MILVLFNHGNIDNLPAMQEGDLLVHAHPECKALNIDGVNERYMEGYGRENSRLDKITMEEIVSTMDAHSRMDLI